MLAAKPGMQISDEASGCALGMAAVAAGCTFRRVSGPIVEKDRRTLGSEAVWGPWLLRIVMRPCSCEEANVPAGMRIKDIVAHLFDHHVMKQKDWSLDQLSAWVATWEPCTTEKPFGLFQDRIPEQGPEDWEFHEWEQVQQAFAAKQQSKRKSRRHEAR
jgi:hypothetical protein